MRENLSLSTPIFGVPLWILILSSTASLIVAACIILCFCLVRRKSHKTGRFSLPKSVASRRYSVLHRSASLDRTSPSTSCGIPAGLDMNMDEMYAGIVELDLHRRQPQRVNGVRDGDLRIRRRVCHHFSMKEIEDATNGLAQGNVIGSGDSGTVYLGFLPNHRRVAVKKLLVLDSSQPKESFASQMEAIGQASAKHKKLVKLLGYCTEGTYRISVSEYIDNGNLHQWLHEFPGEVSPLTWSLRLNILHGVAKGLAYLHEEVEPKIVHGSINSSNVLLDHQWNPKISDFGLCNVLEWGRIIMATLGHVSPDCDSTSIFTEGRDIYAFGMLIMEIISGRTPLDHSQPQAHIVDWFKSMISNGKIGEVVDPKFPETPSSKDLKRIALVALRCVDPEVNPSLKMGDVVSMLETDILLFHEHQISMEFCEQNLST